MIGKTWLMALTTLAAVLAAVLPVGCGNMLTGELTKVVKYKYPVFTFEVIRTDSSNTYKSMSEYTISLKWKEAPENWTEDDINKKLVEAITEGLKFSGAIESRPFRDPNVNGVWDNGESYDVASGGSITAPGTVIMNRYWPATITHTKSAWDAAASLRKAAFDKAVEEIQAIMKAIEKSPLYKEESGNPLNALYRHLDAFIVEDTTGASDFNWNGGEVTYRGGLLYEYFMGTWPPGVFGGKGPLPD